MEPPPPSERILIFGATGKIGTYITSAIANASPPFAKVAIYTSASTVTAKAAQIDALKAQGVEVIVGELNDDDKIKETYQGFDTVVSCLGRAILSQQTRLIALAAGSPSSSIRRFLPSEYGTDILHPVTPDPSAEPPHKHKLEARALLERLASPASGTNVDAPAAADVDGEPRKPLSYTYVMTGPYAEFYVGRTGARGVDAGENAWDRAGGFDAVRRRATLLVDDSSSSSSSTTTTTAAATAAAATAADPAVGLTTMPDTGRCVVAALQRPAAAHNRALRCHSFVSSPRAILAEFEAQTSGAGTWEVRELGVRELGERERAAYERGDAEKGLFSVRRIWTMGGSVYEEGWDDAVLGDACRGSLAEVVREEIERQRREELGHGEV